MGLKAIAFDLDGTLYPESLMLRPTLSLVLRHPLFMYYFSQARVLIRREKFIENFYNKQAEIMSVLLKQPFSKVKAKLEKLIYNEWLLRFKGIKAYPGVKELLEKLKAKGYKLAILSDMPVEKKLNFLKLQYFFDLAFCSEETGYLKPHPKPFQVLIAKLAVKAEEILFIGNSYEYDVVGAAQMGLKTALVFSRKKNNYSPPPDYFFSSYAQLNSFLDSVVEN